MLIMSEIKAALPDVCLLVCPCICVCVQPTDLSDPNPVQMLMLCVHLYERLPQYLPLHTITLSGGLHSTFSKQVAHTQTASTMVFKDTQIKILTACLINHIHEHCETENGLDNNLLDR